MRGDPGEGVNLRQMRDYLREGAEGENLCGNLVSRADCPIHVCMRGGGRGARKTVMGKKRAEEIITKAPEALLWTVAFVEMAKMLQAILHANSEKRSLLVGMFFPGKLATV